MFRNYLKTATRYLFNNKTYASINILGLSISITAAYLIFLVVQYENSFDTFHKNENRIYRVVTEMKRASSTAYAGEVPFAVPEGLRIDYPQLEKVVTVFGEQNDEIT